MSDLAIIKNDDAKNNEINQNIDDEENNDKKEEPSLVDIYEILNDSTLEPDENTNKKFENYSLEGEEDKGGSHFSLNLLKINRNSTKNKNSKERNKTLKYSKLIKMISNSDKNDKVTTDINNNNNKIMDDIMISDNDTNENVDETVSISNDVISNDTNDVVENDKVIIDNNNNNSSNNNIEIYNDSNNNVKNNDIEEEKYNSDGDNYNAFNNNNNKNNKSKKGEKFDSGGNKNNNKRNVSGIKLVLNKDFDFNLPSFDPLTPLTPNTIITNAITRSSNEEFPSLSLSAEYVDSTPEIIINNSHNEVVTEQYMSSNNINEECSKNGLSVSDLNKESGSNDKIYSDGQTTSNDALTLEKNNINNSKEEIQNSNSMSNLEKQTVPTSPILPKENISPESIKPLKDETPIMFLLRLRQYTPEYDIFKYVSKGTQFYLEILDILMKKINFQKMAIDKALRTFLLNYSLPIEAQEIDRVIKAFADKYHIDNPTIYPTADFPYILAYSLIMLNTDLHNPKVKNKITTKQFISNVEHSDIKYYIPKEILEIIYDNIKVSEFISQNQLVQSPSLLLKRKSGVLQRSLSILTRKNSGSINYEKSFNNSKYENEYDVALDLEYSLASLANIKIELSSYLCVDEQNIYDLSSLIDNFSSMNNSSDSLNNQYENSPKMYHNSPLAINNYEYSSTSGSEDIVVEDEIIDNKTDAGKTSREDFQEDHASKIDYINLPNEVKSKKSIDNSDIIQSLHKGKNNELLEKEKKPKMYQARTLPKSPLLLEKGSFLSINNAEVTQSLTAIDSFYRKNSHNYIDLTSTQNMLLSNGKLSSNNNNTAFSPPSSLAKGEIVYNHEEFETDTGSNFNFSQNGYNSFISIDNEENNSFRKNGLIKNSRQSSKMNVNKGCKNASISKLVLQLKEGIMKKGLFCDKYGKYVWNGKMSTYWVVLCEDRLILFSNWKWFINNNKSDRQKKDQSTIITVPKVSYVIPLVNCVCVYSKFEFKEKNIFHLCFEKKDILFEVESRESMIEWMNFINFLSSFITINLNPLKCNHNIKSSDSLNDSITNLEKELDMVLSINNEKKDADNEDKEDSSINSKSGDSDFNPDDSKEKINEDQMESNEKINNKLENNEDVVVENMVNKVNDSSDKINNNDLIKDPKTPGLIKNSDLNKSTELIRNTDLISSETNYIEFENENLLEYYIKDVIEKYEMKNIEYLNNIQAEKKLYSQYIILSPISKVARQKYHDNLSRIIRKIRLNKIYYERYRCYIYFLKNCFEVDVTSNSNIYREVQGSDAYNYIDDDINMSNVINSNTNNNDIINKSSDFCASKQYCISSTNFAPKDKFEQINAL